MEYTLDMDNPVFLMYMTNQYGAPVTGVATPTVTLSTSQAANGTTVTWVETTDFTWHELASGWYKLRQVDSPNVDAVDTAGPCLLRVIKTDVDTAAGATVYEVVAGTDSANILRLVEMLTTTRVTTRATGAHAHKNVAGDTTRYTTTPAETTTTVTETVASA